MTRSLLCVGLLLSMSALAKEAQAANPKIQIAILLDTSNSMDGLINQTREQLWKVVNTFATAKRGEQRPTLELALYEYGNDNLPASNQYVRQVTGLTTNLDQVSEALFSLKTRGGQEYCGAVVQHATQELEWSPDARDLKLIYVAGNEPFSQGPVNYRDSVKAAITRGIVVNTIHAGGTQDGIDGWADAAKLADGNFLRMNMNKVAVRIDAPQDAELARLSGELNKTYIGYGAQAAPKAARQAVQDGLAAGVSVGTASTRAVSKASAHYDNSDWDLVDAKKKGAKPSAMPAAELPPAMQAMSEGEREEYVDTKAKERAQIQEQIRKLGVEREKYVTEESKKHASTGDKAFDDVMIESVKSQATKREFSF